MATIAQQDDEQDPNNLNGSTINITEGTGEGGGTGQGGAAVVSPVKQDAGAQNQNGYTDVASYLNANQTGSDFLGQKASENLTNRYNTTKQGADTAFNQFNQTVQSGYTPENTDLINSVANDPLAAVGNQQTFDQFQKQLNNSYAGPNAWDDYGTQQGKVNEANQYASLASTPGGLNQYTQEIESQTGGPMSQGINHLDTLLLGGNANAMGQVTNAANKYTDLNDYINQMNTAGLQNVSDARNAAKATSDKALNAFTGDTGRLTTLNNTLNSNASNALAAAKARQEAVNTALKGLYGSAQDNTATTLGTYGGGSTPWYNSTNYDVLDDAMSPEALAELGMTQGQWADLSRAMEKAGTSEYKTGHNFGAASPTSQIDLSQFLQTLDPTQAITAGTVATPEQYQEMAAIQKLLGGKTPNSLAINPLNASIAGTAPTKNSNFDFEGAMNYSNSVADAERKAAQDMANNLTAAADKAHADSQHGGFLSQLGDIGKYLNPVGYLGNKEIYDRIKG